MLKKFLILYFIFLWLPFIFLTDFFPFVRFGMFAEPATRAIQTERFFIKYNHQIFKSTQIRMSESVFQALSRKYFYQNKMDFFLQNFSACAKNHNGKWEIWRIIEKDTILVVGLENSYPK